MSGRGATRRGCSDECVGNEFIFVARTPVEEGSSVPTLVTLDPSWSLMEQFASEKTGRVQRTTDGDWVVEKI